LILNSPVPDLLFLDANVVAQAVTRTLVVSGALVDGLQVTWSQHVETEASRHVRSQAMPPSQVRRSRLGLELGPTATSTSGLATESAQDRQVIADAIASRARYLITTDVDDFAFDDLSSHQMSAVNPDFFMALRFSLRAYREGVAVLSEVAKSPPRSPEEVHSIIGRRHPRLTERFAYAFDAVPVRGDTDQPRLLFRGTACVRCGKPLVTLKCQRTGLDRTCASEFSHQPRR